MKNILDSHTLILQIREAFEDCVYPGADNLTSSFGDEADALIADFAGKTDWRELDSGFLEQAPDGWGSALSFFNAAALRFYLPAYLIADVRLELENCDPTVRLCFAVSPQQAQRKLAAVYGGRTLGEHAREEFSLFNMAQCQAIVDYLWWRIDRDDYNPMLEQGLEHYWLSRVTP